MASRFGSLDFTKMLVAACSILWGYYYLFFYICQEAVIRETGSDGFSLWSHREPTLMDCPMKGSDGQIVGVDGFLRSHQMNNITHAHTHL